MRTASKKTLALLAKVADMSGYRNAAGIMGAVMRWGDWAVAADGCMVLAMRHRFADDGDFPDLNPDIVKLLEASPPERQELASAQSIMRWTGMQGLDMERDCSLCEGSGNLDFAGGCETCYGCQGSGRLEAMSSDGVFYGIPLDRRRVAVIMRLSAPGHVVTVSIPDGLGKGGVLETTATPIRLEGPDWCGLVMPLRHCETKIPRVFPPPERTIVLGAERNRRMVAVVASDGSAELGSQIHPAGSDWEWETHYVRLTPEQTDTLKEGL